MSTTTTIARAEIAALLDISLTKLLNIINNANAELPAPLGREGPRLVYDREIILAWIETKPLENLTWKQRPKNLPVDQQVADHTRAFLTGSLGLSKAQLNRNQLRKVIAKHGQGKTQRVEIRGGAYDSSTNQRSVRHQRQAR